MRILISVFVVLVLILGGLLVAPNFIDWSKYKDQGLAQVKSLSGYDVSIGGVFSFGFLPAPHVKAEDVSVINPSVSDQPIATFDALSVSVALMPLLKKAVQVNDVRLVKPEFDLRVDANGKGNWLSPEVEAMQANNSGAEGRAETSDAAPSKAASADVSFEKITIEAGRFRFSDSAKGSVIDASDINLALRADAITGPFAAKGGLVFGGQKIAFDANTGALDAASGSTTLNLDARYGDYDLGYKGVLTFQAPFAVQGEMRAAAKAVAGVDGGVSIDGFISADQSAVSIKNAALSVGDKVFNGEVNATLEPLSAKVAFAGADIINLDELIAKGGTEKSGSAKKSTAQGVDPIAALLDVLPKTLSLPKDANGEIALSLGGVVYQKSVFKGVKIDAVKDGKSFDGEIALADIPGGGPAIIDGALTFGDVSTSKDGAQIYSDPNLSITVQANTGNTGTLVKALSGQSNIPVLSTAKVGKFYIKGAAKPGALTLGESIINLDDMKMSVSGELSRGDGKKALASIKVQADRFDFDALTPNAAASNAGGGDVKLSQSKGDLQKDIKAAAAGFSFPVDLDFDVALNSALMNGQSIKGIAAAGRVRGDALTLTKLGADDFGGASFNVSGGVSNVKTLSGIDGAVSARLRDPYAAAKTFGVDSSAWPKNLGAVGADVKVSGSLDVLKGAASIDALGGSFAFSGTVQKPLGAMSLEGLTVRVTHSDLAKLLSAAGASAPPYAAFSKALDFESGVMLGANNAVTLSNINAKLLGSSMSGAIAFDASGAKPMINGDLKFTDLTLLTNKAGVSSAGRSSGGSSSSGSGEQWSSAAIDSGFLHAANANVKVSMNSLTYDAWNLTAPSLALTLTDGVLDVPNLQAGLFDGQLKMNANVSSASASAPLNLASKADITDVNLGSLASALSGSNRLKAEGSVNLSVDVKGAGQSAKAIVSTLSGASKFNGSNVVIHGFDVAAISRAVEGNNRESILGAVTSFSNGSTAFETVSGDYAIANGVASITNMAMQGAAASIVSTGAVDLPKWTMDTKHTVSFNQTDKLDPYTFSIRGPINKPVSTFANIGKELLNGLAGQFVQEQLQKHLGGSGVGEALQKFGILPAQTQQQAPVGNDNAAQPVQQQAPKSAEEQAQEAIEGVLKGLFQ